MGVLHRYSWLSHGFIPHGFVQTYPRQRRRTPARTCKRLYTSERALSKSSLVKFIHTSTRLVFHCNWEYVSHGVALPDSWSCIFPHFDFTGLMSSVLSLSCFAASSLDHGLLLVYPPAPQVNSFLLPLIRAHCKANLFCAVALFCKSS